MDHFLPVEDSPSKRKRARRRANPKGSLYALSDPALEINQPRPLFNKNSQTPDYMPQRPHFSPPPVFRQDHRFVENINPGAQQFGHRHAISANYPRYGPLERRALEDADGWDESLAPNRPHRRMSQPRDYIPGMSNGPGPNPFESFASTFGQNVENVGYTGPNTTIPSVPNTPRPSGPGLIVHSNMPSPRTRGPGLIISSTPKSASNAGPKTISITPSSRLNPEAREFVPAIKDPKTFLRN